MTRFFSPLLLFLVVATQLGVGCEMEVIETRNTWDYWRQLEWADNSNEGSGGSGSAGAKGYAIELATYTGQDAYSQTYKLIRVARDEGGLANLWYASRGAQTTVYAGRFKSEDSEEAKAMLRKVRSTRINGASPFDDVGIVSLDGARERVSDPRDIRSLSGKRLYTLQIGYFDIAYGSDYRKAAEARVDELRKAGEDAYYYHGPNRSMVTVNAWSYNQAFIRRDKTDAYSNAVRAAQERYPHNVPNGRPFTEDDDPAYVRANPSFLVSIK